MAKQIDGQMSIFEFLQQDKEDAHSSADDLRAQGFINMYDMIPPPGLYEVCDINVLTLFGKLIDMKTAGKIQKVKE